MPRPAASAPRALIAAGAATLLIGLSGCALSSPATVLNTYSASDGTNATLELPGRGVLRLNNMLIVGTGKGKAGRVLGSIGYEGEGEPVQVTLGLDPTSPEGAGQQPLAFQAAPGSVTRVGTDPTDLVLNSVPVEPGGVVQLAVTVPQGGSTTWNVPVVAGVNAYASYRPSEAAGGSPSPTASPEATGDQQPTGEPDAGGAEPTGEPEPTGDTQPTGEPTATAGDA